MLLRLGLLGFFIEFGYLDTWKLQLSQSFRPSDKEYAVYVRLYPVWLSFGWSKYCFPYVVKLDPPFPIGF